MKKSKFSDTEAVNIKKLFDDHALLEAPLFQRNYSWTVDHAGKLWEDLLESFKRYKDTKGNESQYLLGPMVLIKRDDDTMYVIDGQQRLATLTMIFCIFRDFYNEYKNKCADREFSHISNLSSWLENKRLGDHKNWKIKLNHADRIFFETDIQKYDVLNTSEQRINKWNQDKKSNKDHDTYTESIDLIIKNYIMFYEYLKDELCTDFGTDRGIFERLHNNAESSLITQIENTTNFPDLSSISSEIEYITAKKFTEKEKTSYQKQLDNHNKNIQDKISIDEFIDKKTSKLTTKYNKMIKDHVDKKVKEELTNIRINNMLQLDNFLEHILKNIFVVKIAVDDGGDANQIFETFNHSGKKLTNSDLIKNYILSLIKDRENQIKFNQEWIRIFNSVLGSAQTDDGFIIESVRSRDPDCKSLSKNNLYTIITDKVKNEVDSKNFIFDLNKDAEFIKTLNNPSESDTKIRDDVYSLRMLDAKLIRIPILAAYRTWGLNDDFVRLINFLVKFFFKLRVVMQKHPKKIESVVTAITKKILSGSSIDDIIKEMMEDDKHDQFMYLFKEEIIKKPGANIAKYILGQIELNMRGTGDISDVKPIPDLTLEHILPQNTDEWDNGKFFVGVKTPHDRFDKYIFRLGNLTLLHVKINPKIGNAIFSRKQKEGYSESLLMINGEIKNSAKIKEWTAKAIECREEDFIKRASDIWNLKTGAE